MKRFLALIVLMLGLAAVVSPVQARMALGISRNEAVKEGSPRESAAPAVGQAERANPVANRAQRERALGRPVVRGSRVIYLPTVMLAADRAHE
jgi:hypothetical protein